MAAIRGSGCTRPPHSRQGCGGRAEAQSEVAVHLSGFLGAAAGRYGRGLLLSAAGFFEVELGIGVGEKFFDAFTVSVVDRDSDTRGESRVLRVAGHHGADAVGHALGFIVQSFRQDESKFVAPIACSGVNGAAVDAQDVRKAIERVAANQMAVRVVDFLQAVEIEEQYGERPAIAIGALGFCFQDVQQAPVIG